VVEQVFGQSVNVIYMLSYTDKSEQIKSCGDRGIRTTAYAASQFV